MTLLYITLALIMLATLAFLLLALRGTDLSKKRQASIAAVIAAIFFIGGFGLYHIFGAPQIIPLLAARQQEMARLKADITDNSTRVKMNPRDLQAWVKLGEDFMETGQFNAGANAFREAVVISKGNPDIIVAYARAQIEAADGKVTPDAKKALEMALLQQSNNEWARYYLIVWQLQNGKQQQAMAAMKKFYESLPPGSPVRKTIDAQIGK